MDQKELNKAIGLGELAITTKDMLREVVENTTRHLVKDTGMFTGDGPYEPVDFVDFDEITDEIWGYLTGK